MTMKRRTVPFSPPDISELEINEVIEVLKSGWITTGARVKSLETGIKETVGSDGCICLNSQTACAEMALRLMEIGEGDEVITVAYTYTASASVIAHVGAKIVLVDTRPDSLEMDYDALEAAITEKTKAIIPVDLAGIPCNYDRIFEIVEGKKHLFKPSGQLQASLGRVAVMADTAHALGARRHGKAVGSIADFSSFSFHAVKNLTTAEGGALCWRAISGVDSEEIYKRLKVLSLHGQTKDALEKSRLGAWEYDIVGTYYKCNMTDIAAAIGIKQLERYQGLLERRREIIRIYDTLLHNTGIQHLDHYNDEWSSSGHLYITRVPDITPQTRNEIIEKMAERGIACNVHYKPLPLLTAYKNLGFDISSFPNAYAYFSNEITLPLHTLMTYEDAEYVAKEYIDIIKAYR